MSILNICNETTLDVMRGMEIILRYDCFAKIGATNNTIYFGAYSSREMMREEERIDMESWGWKNRGGSWVRPL
jgi:hypothetical protein